MKSDECVDLVDAEGRVIKAGVLRGDVANYPDLRVQIVIGVIFDRDGRMLVHERAQSKRVNPGDVDHVCGVVMAGESPKQAFVREAVEETGASVTGVRLVESGVNSYGRYRHLMIGYSSDEPAPPDKHKVAWAAYMSWDELVQKREAGELTFVNEFFEDASKVLKYLNN